MKRKLEVSELIFKIFAYFLLTIFALCCFYPFVYAVSSSISGKAYVECNQIILLPKGIQFEAFMAVFKDNAFWSSYANTLFLTFFGTIFSLAVAILGAYALSKKRLLFRKGFNFFLVFTMWFSAGVVPQFLNYTATQNIMYKIGITDDKWLVVIAMGMAAMNIILLRNAFEGVPSEIEEAAIVDGATEFQVLTRVYIPMSKATIATVGLFFGISRWNGYYWARTMIQNTNEWPLQVYIRNYLEQKIWSSDAVTIFNNPYAETSIVYAMVVCAIIPILIIYPYIQKYFAKGVNLGGVKE
jgi:putative aldouronate transport system permease protein